MKKIIFSIFIIIPFFVSSCNNKQESKKINLKEVIKSSNTYTAVNYLELSELEVLMAKEPKKIMMIFYQKNCPYCQEMKETTLMDPDIIKLINDNFYAVLVDGKSKEDITFRGVTYINDHANPEDKPWRHNFFVEYIEPYNGGYYWPSTIFLNEKFEKMRTFPGLQKPAQFKRVLQNMINR
jgi:thioredoxin-related protein